MTRKSLQHTPAFASIFLSVLFVSCAEGSGTGSPTGPPQPAQVATVSITGGSNAEVGETIQLAASPRDLSGNTLSGRSVTWTTSAPAIASVSESGLVAAASPGSATITATIGGKTGSVGVSVSNAAVASVEVSLVTSLLVTGRTTQAEAIIKGAKGQILSGRAVSWSTGTPTIASVSSSGVLTGGNAGTTNVIASVEGKTGIAQLTVTQPPVAMVTLSPASGYLNVGASGPVVATLQDATGTILTGRTISWTSTAPSVASVNQNGMVIGIATGSTTIGATSEGVTGTMTVTVTAVAVATVTLSPSAGAMYVGDAGRFTLTLRDVNGNVLTGRAVTWSSSSPSIASAAADGTITALAVGTATVTATSEGKSGSATITVSTRPGAPTDLCSVIGGGSIVAADGKFLGSLTNKYNSQSVLNEFGAYGSRYQPLSIWNEYGVYGGQYSVKSPFNPYTTTPPRLILRDGTTSVWLTVNTYIGGVYVNPYILPTCTNFP